MQATVAALFTSKQHQDHIKNKYPSRILLVELANVRNVKRGSILSSAPQGSALGPRFFIFIFRPLLTFFTWFPLNISSL
jgi:hypothetical protein